MHPKLFVVPRIETTENAYSLERREVKRHPAPNPRDKSIAHAFYDLGLSTRRIAARTKLRPNEIEEILRRERRREMGIGSLKVAA